MRPTLSLPDAFGRGGNIRSVYFSCRWDERHVINGLCFPACPAYNRALKYAAIFVSASIRGINTEQHTRKFWLKYFHLLPVFSAMYHKPTQTIHYPFHHQRELLRNCRWRSTTLSEVQASISCHWKIIAPPWSLELYIAYGYIIVPCDLRSRDILNYQWPDQSRQGR